MIYAGAGVVIDERQHVYNPFKPDCWECGKPMQDRGYWHGQKGHIAMWRCMNKGCHQCSIPLEPVVVPSFSSGRYL